MSRPNNEGNFDVKPSGTVAPVAPATPARAVPSLPSPRVCWSPKLLSIVSKDDLDNRFLVNVSVKKLPSGAVINDIMRGVSGRDTIEDVCASVIAQVRKDGKIAQDQLVSAIFHTVDDNLLIPAGAQMASIFETNVNERGVCVELCCKLVTYNPDQPYVICPRVKTNINTLPFKKEGESSTFPSDNIDGSTIDTTVACSSGPVKNIEETTRQINLAADCKGNSAGTTSNRPIRDKGSMTSDPGTDEGTSTCRTDGDFLHDVNLKHPEYFADSPSAGMAPSTREE